MKGVFQNWQKWKSCKRTLSTSLCSDIIRLWPFHRKRIKEWFYIKGNIHFENLPLWCGLKQDNAIKLFSSNWNVKTQRQTFEKTNWFIDMNILILIIYLPNAAMHPMKWKENMCIWFALAMFDIYKYTGCITFSIHCFFLFNLGILDCQDWKQCFHKYYPEDKNWSTVTFIIISCHQIHLS